MMCSPLGYELPVRSGWCMSQCQMAVSHGVSRSRIVL
jgi:hypothetical protein